MHYTAQGGHLLVAGLIISRSTDSLKITDKNGKTCVHVAAAAGNKEMVALLLGQGAEINTQDKVSGNLKLLIFNKYFTETVDTTPLRCTIWIP